MNTVINDLRHKLASGDKLLSIGTWDVLSAKIIEDLGYHIAALQSFQYAAGWGVPDMGIRTPSDLLDLTFRMAGEVSIPIMVDLEEGFGSPGHAGYWAREFERAGAAIAHIDDGSGEHTCPWLPGASSRISRGPVERTEAMIARMADARQDGLLIAARIAVNPGEDVTAIEEEELERLHRYCNAGADIVFAPFSIILTNDLDRLRRFVSTIGKPVLIQFNPPGYITNYVPRGSTDQKSIANRSFAELFAAGVAIINSPQVYTVAYRAFVEVLQKVKAEGNLEPAGQRMLPFAEVVRLLGQERFTPSEVE